MKTISMKSAVAVAMAFSLPVITPAFAEEEEAQSTEAAEASGEEAAAPAKEVKAFYPLVRCAEVRSGNVRVLVPGGAWTAAVEGHFYPLGTEFSVEAGEGGSIDVVIAFGDEAKLKFSSAAQFAVAAAPFGTKERALHLVSGAFDLSLPGALKSGMFSVSGKFFTCADLAGDSHFEYVKNGDGDEAVVRCVTGSMSVKGRHYSIARMAAANQLRIRSSADDLFTSLRGESGDIKMVLDQGVGIQKDFETGEESVVARNLEFVLSPQCAVKIFRAVSKIGGRIAVSTMTFDAQGVMKNRVAFAENRPEVNSGELVVSKRDVENAEKDAKKKESEETEDVEVDADKSKEEDSKKDEEKKNDEE